ncbi:peptidase family M1-domain-containing protein [Paraphysoderma sedebokerense]|nr:peptidase family M1-domain-containing protein [Paraphysoderma sedebokerense]
MPCRHFLCTGIIDDASATTVAEYDNSYSMSDFTLPGATLHYAPSLTLEPIHLDISLKFDIPNSAISAAVVQTFRSNASVTTSSLLTKENCCIKLNAVGFQDLDVQGNGLKEWDYDGDSLTIWWNVPFTKDETRSVTITYKVERPVSGMFFSASSTKGSYAITDHETERARYWLPCVDFPTVRPKLDFHLTAPKHMIAVANGSWISESLDNDAGMKTTNWKLDYPCPSYLLCLAVGEFEEVDHGAVDGMPIKYYAVKGTPSVNILNAFDQTPSMVKWLSKKLGVKFPWPKYYQIANPDIRGAMENISFVTWGDHYLMDDKLAKERKFDVDTINIHEMAHTYFGDMTVIRHFEHAWLKESWATYMESVWIAENYPSGAKDMNRWYLYENALSYINETKRYMRPIVSRLYDTSWQLFDNHTYPGGAWRIHMLRNLLGDDVFWPAVTKYLQVFQSKVVETEDFRRTLESHSGVNLVQFFDQWFYSKGYPHLKVSMEHNKDTEFVKFCFEQTQVSRKDNIPCFAFSIDVEVTDSEGKVYTATAKFDGNNQRAYAVVTGVKSKPNVVEIDPNGKILCAVDFNPSEDILGNIVRNGRDLVNRIWAYKGLITNGGYSAMKKVRTAIKEEKFFGVRTHVASALSESKTPYAIDILADMLKSEDHPMALWSIASACYIRHSKIRDAAKYVLGKNGIGYRARANLLKALGYQRHPDDLEFLLSVAQDPSKMGQHAIVRSGALMALGYHRSLEGFKYLLSRISADGTNLEPPRAQGVLYEAISASGRYQELHLRRTAVETVCHGIYDSDLLTRFKAISALVGLEAKNKLGDIEKTESLYAKIDWPWVLRRLSGLKGAGGESETVKLGKRIEELESRLKKMEEKWMDKEAVEEAEKEAKKEQTEKEAKKE